MDWFTGMLGFGMNMFNSWQNREAQKDANQANVRLWQMQSEYNKPINQMTRLQEAGLNPNLAYGQVAESRASNPPPMQPAPLQLPDSMAALATYQQVKNMQVMNAKANIEIEKAKAEAIKAASDADYSVWENQKLKDSGTLKSDPTMIKTLGRGLDKVDNYVRGVIMRTKDLANDAVRVPMKLIKYVGNEELNHSRLVGPVPIPDGGQ